MPYSVSSGFGAKVLEKSPTILRKFLIGTSDYSAFVLKWPTIKRRWNEIKPQSITVNLSNHGKTFNFFKANPEILNTDATLQIGPQFAVGSEELINVFTGKVGRTLYKGATASVRIVDKFKQFSERVVGSKETAVDFTTSNYLPSDIAWALVTSHGGLSAITSTSNPDIDFTAFSEWANVFSFDTVLVNAYYEGEKVTSALRTLGRMTASSIYEEEGKITFARFSMSSLAPFALPNVKGVQLDLDDSKIINSQIVNAGYNVNSDLFGITVFDTNSASVNSYGLREQVEDSNKFWYTNSVSALNLSQRQTSLYSQPFEGYSVTTALQPLSKTIGDTVTFSHQILDVGGDSYRIMAYRLNMERAEFSLDMDGTQLVTQFILDATTLGLLDQSFNPLG